MANVTRDPSEDSITKSTAINKRLDLLDKKMDGLYKDIYISRPDNRYNLDSMIDSLDDVLDKLQGSDSTVAGMSELLRRVDNNNGSNTENMVNSVRELFEDQNIVGSLMMNDSVHNFIAAQNHNFDLICKYLPRLQDALEIKRDNVLCSDNFSKSFINPKGHRSSKEESLKFAVNCDKLEDEYDLAEFFDKTYMNTSKYGEDFIYVVPYNVAFERLFRKANLRMNSARVGSVTLFEGYSESVCVKEGFQTSKDYISYLDSVKSEVVIDEVTKNMPQLGQIKLSFNPTNSITNIVGEHVIVREQADVEKFRSLSNIHESMIMESGEVLDEAKTEKMDSLFNSVKKRNSKLGNPYTNDGLITDKSLDRDPDKLDKNFLGAVLERIPRENILPVYIGKKCVGYYYFEFAEDPTACGYCGGHHNPPMIGNASKMEYNMSEQQNELAMRYISARISQSIDAKFINANKDLKEEIYEILRYNEKFDMSRSNNIGVTFIPAEDMIHCYFEIDDTSHRGISDLARAVTPAMLYILLYLTDIIGKITRSTDKRVYYVKQNVETNVARTMMNVVQQIKKSNMGIREIQSMNNILNIVGKYNDLIIPLGPSGEAV